MRRAVIRALPHRPRQELYDEESRELLHRRVALFCRLLFWVFVLLSAWALTVHWLFPELRPARADVGVAAALGTWIVISLLWLVARRPHLGTSALHRIDAIASLLVSLLLGVELFLAADKPANVFSFFLWATLLVFGRVLMVPSSSARTLRVSAAAMAPLALSGVAGALAAPGVMGAPPAAQIAGALLFSGLVVVVSAIGSGVIYGLRRQVHEARRLGQYTLEDKIGEGGMGVVYRARHALLRRPTAIKLLPAGRSGPRGLERFEREVQRTAELTHPNTIHVYDYGRSLDGIFYYAMEYLEGIDLERLVRSYGPQPPDRAVPILRQICGSLGEAHARGLVHRDVKPANVMLCRRGGLVDFVKVLDFGLVEDRAEDADPHGAAPPLAGTPAYLAPEATLDPHATGASADVYALGCLAYFLVTGTEVFAGRSALEVCAHHQHTPPEPPSRRAPKPLPPRLDEIILACLRKDPGERPRSVDEVDAVLASIPDGGSWRAEDARRWWAELPETVAPAPRGRDADTSDDTLPVDEGRGATARGAAVLVPGERGRRATPPSATAHPHPRTAR